MIRQTILPFKLEMTKDLPARASQWQAGMITPLAGLALLGEFTMGLGFLNSADRYLPTPGSGEGYHPSEYIFLLILMLNAGGRNLEGNRQIRTDEELREVLPLEPIPSSNAFGGSNWAYFEADLGPPKTLARRRGCSSFFGRCRELVLLYIRPRNAVAKLTWRGEFTIDCPARAV